ncbi:lamin tail domain-containing protein, partial [Streptomyces sp. NPDC127574]|uniref:lamin tail domain-containing protein n=1 Tax=Streptomyces sp. NPDC127574 TaxID=3345401 RepID=UPI0036434A6A
MTVSRTARRLTAVGLTTAAVTAAIAVPASAADHRSHRQAVEISSVQYDSPGWDNRSNRSQNSEQVEITNYSHHGVNPDDWTLADEGGRTYTFVHYRLAGRATVRVHTGTVLDSRRDVYQGTAAPMCGPTAPSAPPCATNTAALSAKPLGATTDTTVTTSAGHTPTRCLRHGCRGHPATPRTSGAARPRVGPPRHGVTCAFT